MPPGWMLSSSRALQVSTARSRTSLAPSDVDAFFASYKAEIVHLAEIAEQGDVASFAIGNEMSSLSGDAYRGYWS